MDLMDYMMEDAVILIPVLWIIGTFLKRTPRIPDWTILWILLILGIFGANFKMGISFHSTIQGILATGAAVLSHQLFKQTSRRD